MPAFQIKYNGVVVIQSLMSNEPQTGKMLFDDIIARYCDLKGHGKYFYNTNAKADFIAAMHQICNLVINDDLYPILHFEVHGCSDGLKLNNGETIDWKELEHYCRLINIQTNNQLIVTLATCWGSTIWKMIDITKPAPYWGFLGPKESIYNSDLLEDFTEFYESLLIENSWDDALQRIVLNDNRSKYVYLHCKGIFEYYIEKDLKGLLIDKYQKFKKLSGQTKLHYPNLNRAARRKQLKYNITLVNRDRIIASMKRIFLMG